MSNAQEIATKYEVFDHMIEGVQVISPDFRYLYVNEAVCRYAMKSRQELLGHTVSEAFPGMEDSQVYRLIEACLADGELRELQSEFRFDDGSVGHFQLRIQSVPEGVIIMSYDITAQVRAEQLLQGAKEELEQLVEQRTHSLNQANAKLSRLVETDALTGLHNRRYFDAKIESEFERCRRYSIPLSLASLDLDHFKRVNDEYGHDCGDRVLSAFGSFIKSRVRAVDSACRVGGEEFCILMPETGPDAAAASANRIRESFAVLPLHCDQATLRVTCSIGVASLTDDVTDVRVLLKRADQALYEAKGAGRNAVFAYDPRGQVIERVMMA